MSIENECAYLTCRVEIIMVVGGVFFYIFTCYEAMAVCYVNFKFSLNKNDLTGIPFYSSHLSEFSSLDTEADQTSYYYALNYCSRKYEAQSCLINMHQYLLWI